MSNTVYLKDAPPHFSWGITLNRNLCRVYAIGKTDWVVWVEQSDRYLGQCNFSIQDPDGEVFASCNNREHPPIVGLVLDLYRTGVTLPPDVLEEVKRVFNERMEQVFSSIGQKPSPLPP